jgi:hypothetical protein
MLGRLELLERSTGNARRAVRAIIVVLTLTSAMLIDPAARATIPIGTATVSTADAEIVGTEPNRELGQRVAGVGDTDGDGFDDVVVMNAFGTSGDPTNHAYLFLGPIMGTLQDSEADAVLTLAEHIRDVERAGDVNGDGFADIIVGSPYSTTASPVPGAAWIVYGPLSGSVDVDAVARS